MNRPWLIALAERGVKDILNAHNRAELGDHAPAQQVLRDLILEVIADTRLIVVSDIQDQLAESFDRVTEVEIDK